jgi:hypothetical protein
MKKSLALSLCLGLCALTIAAQAQIPNPGFEDWTDTHTPVGWFTNNVDVSGWITISQTGPGESHSGSYAMHGEVISVFTVAYPPLAFTGSFPCSQRYAQLTGWYKFSPVNGDLFSIGVVVYGNTVGGGGTLDIAQSAEQYGQFSVPITYSGSGDPDSAMIVIEILREDTAEVNVGSSFVLDDLAFEGIESVPETPVSQISPAAYTLYPNYPNPFNPTTTIRYDVRQAGPVELTVFDLLGKEVAKLASGSHPAGSYTVTWDAADMPSGTYLCVMKGRDFAQTEKLLLVK